jgi:putative endonuclease
MTEHIKTGRKGEEMAVGYLTGMGFTILHKNWRHSHWEVDIIATTNNKLHFIEVKTRRSVKFGTPDEGVSKKKIKNLIDAAEEFMYLFPEWKMLQFDILSITLLKGQEPAYLYIEDVYI